jgi:hypothetical membrane protein
MKLKKALWLKISALSGILASIITITFILLAIAFYPPFSWTDNALSDLGVQEGATAVLFNSGLIIGGILTLIFASGLLAFFGNFVGRSGAFIFVLDSLALAAIGVFPENVKPQHFLASVAFFVLAPIAMLVISVAFLLMKSVKLVVYTFMSAFLAALVWVIQWSVGFGSDVAIPEAFSALLALTWFIVLSVKMFKEASISNK